MACSSSWESECTSSLGTRKATSSREVREVRERLHGRDAIRSIGRRMARRYRGDDTLEPALKIMRLLWRGRSHDERSVAISIMAQVVQSVKGGSGASEPSHEKREHFRGSDVPS